MRKRLFVLLLALLLLAEPALGLLPTAEAASVDALSSSIASYFDAYAAKRKQTNSANDCVDALLYPAMFGNGSAQSFGESSAVTAAIYNSKLFRDFMVNGLTSAIQHMQRQGQSKAMTGGQPSWYNSAMYYTLDAYIYNETTDISDDIRYSPLISRTQYTGSVNRDDQALMLVAGSTECRLLIKQTWVGETQIGYRIDVTVSDTFDFGSTSPSFSTSGFNTVYIKMLNAMGKLLRLKTYKWTSKSSFEVTVPNPCSHTTGNFRWEESGGELVSLSGDGLIRNDVTKIARNLATDVKPQYYYALDKKVFLSHKLPWTVELSMQAGSAFSLNPVPNYSNTLLPTLLKRGTGFYGAYCEYYRETSLSSGKLATFYTRHQYGLDCADYGVSSSGYHTYLLENRIAADGSNMVWLTVDGRELGELRQHSVYKSNAQVYEDLPDAPAWISGKDFTVNYLFSSFSGFSTSMPVQYLEIRNDFPCVTTKTAEATCTKPATEISSCSLCGGSWTKETAPALGHTEEILPGTAATCTETGLTEGRKCTVCGETTVKQDPIPVLGHTEETVPGKAPTCLEEGLSDGKVCTICGVTTVNQEILPAVGHSPETVPGKAPACLEEGLTDGSRCAVCGETLTSQEPIPATGHTEGPMTEKAPTCAETGLTGGTACTLCGTVLTPQETVPTLPHSEQSLPGKAPTCSETGLTEGAACANCGTILTPQQSIPTLPHTPEVIPGKAPTCTEDGLTEGSVCIVCGEVLTAQQPISAAHTWDEGTVTTKPTTETPGVKTYTCTACGATRQEELPMIEGSPTLWGDVNGDGRINFKDSVLILQYASGRVEAEQLDLTVADVNGDEKYNFKDAVLILQFASGRIEAFPAL